MNSKRKKDFKFSIPWNLSLIALGSIIFVIGINGIVLHHTFIPGGFYGFCLFINYKTGFLSPGVLFFLLNIPFCLLGGRFISSRFVLYTIYGICVMSVASEYIVLDFGIEDQLYAAIAAGCICGVGGGIILRTFGSAGALDVIAIILYKYFNIGLGKTFLIFNVLLFSLVITNYSSDILIASILLTYVSSNSLDYTMRLFNQRKIVYVISDFSEKIANTLVNELNIGATFIKGQGVYSKQDKNILMAITNNIHLKRLEERVFSIDNDALFIVEESYDVIGASFRKRKIY